MNNLPETIHDWVYETISVSVIEAHVARLEKLRKLAIIGAVALMVLFCIKVANLHDAGNLNELDQGWVVAAFAFSMVILLVLSMQLSAQMLALSPISREDLARLAQETIEYSALKKQLLQQLLLQNNVIYERQRKAFLQAISNAKTDRTLASLTEAATDAS